VTTRINITVDQSGLLSQVANQTRANHEALVVQQEQKKIEEVASKEVAKKRTALSQDIKTGEPLPIAPPPSGGIFGINDNNRIGQYPAANRRGGDIGFVLAPGAAVTPLSGPFGDFVQPGWPFGFQSVGINGLSKGYANTLWGSQAYWLVGGGESKYPDGLPVSDYSQCIPVPGFQHPYPPPVSYGGGYEVPAITRRVDFCGGSPAVYEVKTAGSLTLQHLIADGSDLRFEQGGVLFPSGELPTLSGLKRRSSATFEAIVRFGARPFTEADGSTFFRMDLLNFSGGGLMLDLGANTTNYGIDFPGGVDLHVAMVASTTGVKTYLNGNLSEQYSNNDTSFIESPGPMLCTIILDDYSLLAFIEVYGLGWQQSPEYSTEYNGPSVLKGVRYTSRALYTGTSFTPPTSLTTLA
jgi:hypothetical protein